MKTIVFLIISIVACAGLVVAGEEGPVVTIVLGKNIQASLTESTFYPGQAKIETCSSGSGICRINGGIPFGVAAGMPKTFLSKLTVSMEHRTYTLDTGSMYNAWGKRPAEGKGAVKYLAANCYDPLNCIVRGVFSEGAAAYVAEWAIVDGRATRTMLTGSKDIVDLFTKHLDPPGFE
jgi:hypothetical protein